jgi:hypothetical protein
VPVPQPGGTARRTKRTRTARTDSIGPAYMGGGRSRPQAQRDIWLVPPRGPRRQQTVGTSQALQEVPAGVVIGPRKCGVDEHHPRTSSPSAVLTAGTYRPELLRDTRRTGSLAADSTTASTPAGQYGHRRRDALHSARGPADRDAPTLEQSTPASPAQQDTRDQHNDRLHHDSIQHQPRNPQGLVWQSGPQSAHDPSICVRRWGRCKCPD